MEHRVPHLCHHCFYDVSASAEAGFPRCPECGAPVRPPGPPVLRDPGPAARAIVLALSLSPILAVPIIASLVASAHGNGFFGFIAAWIGCTLGVYALSWMFEHARNPRQDLERALVRTAVIVLLQIAIPAIAGAIVSAIGAIIV